MQFLGLTHGLTFPLFLSKKPQLKQYPVNKKTVFKSFAIN